jgi:Protein of unknown function (DUF2380)
MPKSIVVMDFDLQDDTAIQGGPVDVAAQEKRLQLIVEALRHGLAERQLYRVISDPKLTTAIQEAQKTQTLSECNGCEIDIAKAFGAERVMVGWVQKVSNLIINVNIGVKDIASGRTLYVRSVDVRGNTDDSWLRAIRRLTKQIEEDHLHLR